jgi:hypothetical protein
LENEQKFRTEREEKMKRSIVITAMTIMIFGLLCNQANAGYIKGQLTDGDNYYLDGVNVTFFNSENAQIINTTISDGNGYFMSPLMPAGQYKIQLSLRKDDYCQDEFLSLGEAHDNVFDTGIAITVGDKQTISDLGVVTALIDKPYYCGTMSCVKGQGTIDGYVVDSSTGDPIPGIQVQFKDPITAFPKWEWEDVTTDSDGYFVLDSKENCSNLFQVKVRFYDPKGVYSAEYYGSGGVDDFSKGTSVSFLDTKLEIDEDLALMPPAAQIGQIIRDIQTILPPKDAQPVASSLLQGKALIEDSNPNNDQGACGILTSTTKKIKNLVSSGSLSQTDADVLIASIDALEINLKCDN